MTIDNNLTLILIKDINIAKELSIVTLETSELRNTFFYVSIANI